MADAKLKAIISVANKASGPLRAINSDLNKLRSPIRGLSSQLRGLDRSSGFKDLRRGVSGLAGELGKVAAVGAGAAAALFAGVNKMAETGDEIIKTATNFDISTDALQEWRFVAERSGVSQAALNKSMQAFTKRMAEARNGTGELHGLLKNVNPEFLKQLLAIKDNTKAYDFMIKGMAKLPDQQRQILLGDKAFSEAGRELVKITAQGADEIEKLKKQAHELGLVLDNETLVKSASFRDEMTNVAGVVKGLMFAVGSELMPEIKNLLVDLKNWYLLNKDVIKPKVAEFAKNAAAGIRDFVAWVKETAPVVKRFIDNIGGIKTIAIAVGAVLAGPLLSAIATLGSALLLTPFGAFVSAALFSVGMITGAFNPLAKFFPEIWEGIVNTVGKFIADQVADINEFMAFIGRIGDVAKSAFDVFKAALAGLRDFVVNGFAAIGQSILKSLEPVLSIGKKLAGFLPGFVKNSLPGQAITQLIKPVVGPVSGQGRRINQSVEGGVLSQSTRPSLLSASKTEKSKTEVGGKIQLEINSAAPVRVRSIKSDNPAIGLDVDAGLGMAAM